MAYSAPRTWSAGDKPTAAQFNQDIRDNASFLANPPACRVYHNTTQSIPDNTETVVSFNSERYDTNSMHSTSVNTSRITINTAGLYLVTFGGAVVDGSDYIQSYANIRLNGATFIAYHNHTGNGANTWFPLITLSTVYKFAVSDYIEVLMYQDNSAGAARNLRSTGNWSPEFSATWIGLG